MNQSPDQTISTFDITPYKESLYQLFLQGPVYDGDVISKNDRSVLVQQGFAERYEGYTYLTRAGIRLSLALKFDREKQNRQRRDREKLADYDRLQQLNIQQLGGI